ncbi:hypothetical protein Vadar_025865 [Vaccinium darrowii]|uniref:Uncharacterized protein n=1 Tax=Vaccinium darrowii TaxID=229202 RepID=A0ACB7YG31_9ERIC|nr:hypothetical protein Vadar_025865 [Vaccinium darrowii]
MRLPSLRGDTKSVKLTSWKINGLSALLKLEGFLALHLAQREDFDVLWLEEAKLQSAVRERCKALMVRGDDKQIRAFLC